MEKIYIGKTIFDVSKQTKTLLDEYLDELKEYVLDNDVDLEIYEDIKSRIEEKLIELNSSGSIKKSDVQKLIDGIGDPTDIFALESDSSGESKSKKTINKLPKFYKDSKNGKVMGVCAGLGEGLGIEPVWMRVMFIVFFFFSLGLALLIYLILGIVLDEKKGETVDKDTQFKGVGGAIRKLFDLMKQILEKILNLLR